ncbi:aminotransferase class III-fold pyridoxal phosphate-dependent enzyme [Sinorhizobium meliloti]|uniref:aminotransferase class III-fold pyridoxal phosphate-dependent enzyme n=1 Tax=Rhizobium meliloti TaxID=382 RepID=UPI00038247D4|nr:aminotransferase class III-fold pyridoxal phosphate-dependent enzyme [Sinorhizobium meliloti]
MPVHRDESTKTSKEAFPAQFTGFDLDFVVYDGICTLPEFFGRHWVATNFPPADGLRVLEIDCGFGLLGLSLAKRGAKFVTSVDRNARAVVNTAENAKRNGVTNFETFQSDIFSEVPADRRFDIIFWHLVRQPRPHGDEHGSDGKEGMAAPAINLLQSFLVGSKQRLAGGSRVIVGLYGSECLRIFEQATQRNQLRASTLTSGTTGAGTEPYRLLEIEQTLSKPYKKFDVSALLTGQATRLYPAGVTRVSIGALPISGRNCSVSLYARSGTGATLTDVDGNSYIDYHNNFSTLIHGHGNPSIRAAITSQLERGTCFGNPTEADVKLANAICQRVPVIQRLRFLNTGTEAVMFAIKAARAATGRQRVAKFEGAFHGTYDWAEVSVRNKPDNWGDGYPLSNPPYRGTPTHVCDDVIVLPFNHTKETQAILDQHKTEIACILVDVLPCAVGMMPINPDYLDMLQQTARQHGIVLISDEVVSFRLGFHGASAAVGLEADLVTLGKVVGGGLPIGVVGGSLAVMETFSPQDSAPVPQGGTFSANPLTTSAGLAALEALTNPEIIRIGILGDHLRQSSEQIAREAGMPLSVQGAGSMFRFHAKRSRPTTYREAYLDSGGRQMLERLHVAMLERGIYVAAPFWGSVSTAMTGSHVDHFLDALRECFRAIPELKRYAN